MIFLDIFYNMIPQSKSWIFIVLTGIILILYSSARLFFANVNIYSTENHTTIASNRSAERIDLTVLYQKLMQKNNHEGSRELLNIALSSPWLFPKSKTLFPYLGMHNDLDALLQTMAYQSKKILILGFNRHWQVMLQNNIFTLVKFTQTFNYIIATGDELSLLVCIELNLPCYNASSYMLRLKNNVSTTQEGYFNDSYYLAIVWYLIPLYLDILRKGFTIMKSDVDISYAGKNIWKTFELMIEETGADLLFMKEIPVNTGQIYALYNERVIAFFEEWIASQRMFEKRNDQEVLADMNGKFYTICTSKKACSDVKTLPMKRSSDYQLHNQKKNMAAVSTYPSSFTRFGGLCPPNEAINPCDQDILYVHPICITGTIAKINKLKQLGFWLMADPCLESKLNFTFPLSKFVNASITRCIPTPLMQPTMENSFLHCNNSTYAVFNLSNTRS